MKSKWSRVFPASSSNDPHLYLFIASPGREWNDFVHATNRLVAVAIEKLKLTIGRGEIIVEPGNEEVRIPKGGRHFVKNISSFTAHWLYGYER